MGMFRRRAFLGAAAGWITARSGIIAAQVAPNEAENKKKRTTGTEPKSAISPDADPIRADESINRVLASIRDRHHLPGMVGALVRGGRLAAIGVVGVRKLGEDAPMLVTDRVHIGSCTKAMTATLLGLLVDEGKLSWTSTIAEVFPGLTEGVNPEFRSVTLSHLLTHRAGLPHDGPWRKLGRERSPTEQRRELLRRMLREPPESRPGTTYAYSNVGYALAGLMAEEVTGQSWETLMRARLFEPLGMTTAGFGPPGRPGALDEPWGHHEEGGKVQPIQADNAPSMGPAGTVHLSIPDWSKFAALHLQGARGKARLLKPSTFRTLHTPPKGFDYAGGWYVVERPWAGGRALNHNGSNTTWYASIWIAPARDLAFLTATNQGGDAAETACEEAIRGLIQRASARPGAPRRRTSGLR